MVARVEIRESGKSKAQDSKGNLLQTTPFK